MPCLRRPPTVRAAAAPPTGALSCRAATGVGACPHFAAQSALLGRVELLSKIEKKTTNRRPDVNKSAQPAFRRAGTVDILPSALTPLSGTTVGRAAACSDSL